MKKIIVLLLCATLLVGCTPSGEKEQKQYTATFITLFDTVTTIVGKAESREAFEASVAPVRDALEHYHRLFDIYNEYDGIANLKTVNDKAAIAPVAVDSAIIELLEDCKRYYEATGGVFNPAMGSVLSLWHTAREDGLNDPSNAYLPNSEELAEAAKHTSPDSIIIDRENSTVFFSDSALKLDVGAIAKGWAVERVCETAPSGLLISVGGNVCATGPKSPDGTPWAVGISDPAKDGGYLHILNVTKECVVTSGSYQRTYAVGGKLYHHIIDPYTLYPGERWLSVSVVCDDSGLADALSTALFLLDRESGEELLARFGAQALWVDNEGNKYYSPDFRALIRN